MVYYNVDLKKIISYADGDKSYDYDDEWSHKMMTISYDDDFPRWWWLPWWGWLSMMMMMISYAGVYADDLLLWFHVFSIVDVLRGRR